MEPPVAGVVRLAAASRVLVLALSLLARLLFRPYDTSASLTPPCLSAPASSSDPNASVSAAVSSLAVWDGVHFARPAECGYEYEQSFAFLPAPPGLPRAPRPIPAVLVLSGYVLNNVAFVAAAAYFYRYSESLYALFSLGGLLYLFSGANTVAVIMLALSGSARSNGALNAGYFCFQALLQAYDAAVRKKRPLLVVLALVAAALRSIFIFLPFFAFQAYGYLNICVHGNSEELRPWCKAKVPLLYGFIQSHYWSVHALFPINNSLYGGPTDSIAYIPTSVPLMKVVYCSPTSTPSHKNHVVPGCNPTVNCATVASGGLTQLVEA
ncbi:GPI mannosyltransferase 2-like [Panicum miliaceum]|uniref:GPI mannosyltransferase 2 n=1 Tax=Panicum miliaceum TaxID=4540 RepID=A0A3L6STY0_PANMI|nr:GPI mannosyltransferase 2-like [Panicum miliaceum]